MEPISNERIFLSAWKIVREHLSYFVGFILFVALVNFTPEIILQKYEVDLKKHKDLAILLQVSIFLIQLLVGYLLVKIPLLLLEQREISLNSLFFSKRVFFNYTIGTAIYGTSIVILLILMGNLGSAGIILFIPLIFIILKFQFVNYIIVDKGVTVVAAFRISHLITSDYMRELFMFFISLFLLNLMGAFIFLVGLLFTLPISIMAMTLLYKELIKKVSFQNEG